MIPTIITQLLNGETRLRLGSLEPTRDFNYVADTVGGFMALAESDAAVGEEVNISTGTEHTIGEVADLLIRELNPDASVVTEDARLRPENSEVYRLIGDNSKIARLAGWNPRYDLRAGLHETVRWFREPSNLGRYKAWLYNL